ncbi:uridine kinase [Anaerolineae bacterium]|nr:uridine kinase [Anaerolineae bacterium]
MDADSIKPVTIGVAGGTGSGKTTVAQRLVELIGKERIAYIPHDAYYHGLNKMPRTAGEIVNFDHPDALDTPLLIEHLTQLRTGQPVHIPVYDFVNHSRSAQTNRIEPHPIILVEGILIFADAQLRSLLDVRIFVDTDADIRFIRRLERDISERGRSMESVIHQYLESVRPMHLEFVEPSKRYAHLIIPEGGFNTVAIGMVADFIRDKMRIRE